MNVLLVAINSKYIHSSLAIRYLREYCRETKYNIQLKEYSINESIDTIVMDISDLKTNVICFSCYIWNIEIVLKISQTIKKIMPETKIILGGPEVSYDSKNILNSNPYIDYIVIGEGEKTLKQLLNSLSNPICNNKNIAGTAFREGKDIIISKPRELLCNLDTIPFPYIREELVSLKDKIIYYESTRGCPFNCSYCLSSTIKGVRYFSLDRVKEDLSLLMNFNVKQVKFVDRTFNIDTSRSIEIFKYIIKNRRDTTFHFEVGANLLNKEIIEYLKTVPKGIFQFEIGVQSTNNKVLKNINRIMDYNKLRHNIIELKNKDNIHLHLDLIVGLPEEDYESIKKSFNDLYALKPHYIQLGFLKLLKGTQIRKENIEYDYKYRSYPPYEVISNKHLSFEKIKKLKHIEDIIDKFINSNSFNKSLNWIMKYYNTPFDFFETLEEYYRKEGIIRISISKKDLYELLYNFYQEYIGKKKVIFKEYLKFDYIKTFKNTNIPKWYDTERIRIKETSFKFLKNNNIIKRYLPEYLDKPAKQIFKKVDFEVFRFDVLNEKINSDNIVVLFDYHNDSCVNVTKDWENLY